MDRRTALTASFVGLGLLASHRARAAKGESQPEAPAKTPEPVAAAAAGTAGKAPDASPDDADGEVRALVMRQAEEWSAGDLGAFCGHYADDCMLITSAGLITGRHEMFARYRRKYQGQGAMGALTVEVLHLTASATVASAALAWTLTWPDRPAAERTKRGHSVVTLVRDRSGAWRIVYDAST